VPLLASWGVGRRVRRGDPTGGPTRRGRLAERRATEPSVERGSDPSPMPSPRHASRLTRRDETTLDGV
jgi:hypothetical protein